MTKMKNIKTFKRRTAYPRYVVRMLNWFHMLLSYRQKTKHCKTQWKMTFLYIFENCKQWTWLAFWGTSNLFPIYIIIYIYIIYLYMPMTGNIGPFWRHGWLTNLSFQNLGRGHLSARASTGWRWTLAFLRAGVKHRIWSSKMMALDALS